MTNSLVTYPNFQTALRQRIAGGKTGRQGPSVQSKDPTRKQLIKTSMVVSSYNDGFPTTDLWWKQLIVCVYPKIDFSFISNALNISSRYISCNCFVRGKQCDAFLVKFFFLQKFLFKINISSLQSDPRFCFCFFLWKCVQLTIYSWSHTEIPTLSQD